MSLKYIYMLMKNLHANDFTAHGYLRSVFWVSERPRHVGQAGRVPGANAPGSSPRAAACIRTCFRTYAQAQSVVKPEVHFETSLCVIFLPRLFHLQIFLSKYIFWS
jgi:hypothetical protein